MLQGPGLDFDLDWYTERGRWLSNPPDELPHGISDKTTEMMKYEWNNEVEGCYK